MTSSAQGASGGRLRAGERVRGRSEGPAVRRVRAALARLAEVDRPDVWITLVPQADLLAAARVVDDAVAGGADLPLAGTVLAVKDNVDVRGLPTTAGCPSYAAGPDGRPVPAARTAPAVAALVDAGAVVLGKTNLDQFATGLVGTRSAGGPVRHATLTDRVAGGSSSGSAVAVALGVADIGVGTDTAGSGRVPAALHGLVGIKTTIGLVPTDGVLPACRSYDVVTTLTRELDLGVRASRLMVVAGRGVHAGPTDGPAPGPDDASSDPVARRTWPDGVRVGLRARPVVAVPRAADLAWLGPSWRAAFARAVVATTRTGARVVEIDLSGMLAAARLLYDGALVAERYAAVGAFLDADPTDADPVVAGIIRAGREIPAHAYARDRARLAEARAAALVRLGGCDLLLVPTTTEHPTLSQVAADPVGVNARLGTYSSFVNLLDLAAVAVPAGTADDGPFGVSVVARAFDDQLALDLAARLLAGSPGVSAPLLVDDTVALVVVGGEPATRRHLEDLGGRYEGTVGAAATGTPMACAQASSAGSVSAGSTSSAGWASSAQWALSGDPVPSGEVWRVAPAALGRLLGALPGLRTLGPVPLADGTTAISLGATVPPQVACGRADDDPTSRLATPLTDDAPDRRRA